MKIVKFEKFLKFANFFYTCIGVQPYHKEDTTKIRARVDSVIWYFVISNINIQVFAEFVYLGLAFSNATSTFIETTMIMSYIGFMLVGIFKMLFVWLQKDALTILVKGLQKIYPDTELRQKQFNLRYYLGQCNIISICFSSLYMCLIWTYNLFNIVQYYWYDKWLGRNCMGKTLPYTMYIPWDYSHHWSYYILYVLQNYAAYTNSAGQIASDLLLIACVTQIIMHFDHLSELVANYEVKLGQKEFTQTKAYDMDMEFLRSIIKYHTHLLDLCETANNVFGLPLLLNFSANSFVICFVGFQITIGASPDILVRLVLFLTSSAAQVYLICHYSQQLIDASVNVAAAVYNQKWGNADVRYKKMLVLMALRAQKPAQLRATTFVLISRGTMTELMQLSYKFFALLRTMYAPK